MANYGLATEVDPSTNQHPYPKALNRLVELYTATNKPEEVKKWQAERTKYPSVAPVLSEKK
jgi:hypothetical protein